MEDVLKLSNTGTILGLRELANNLSSHLRVALSNEKTLVLDFEKVETISSSFADELIAKLFVEFGAEKFIKYIKIKNANDFIKTMINSSISERLKLQ